MKKQYFLLFVFFFLGITVFVLAQDEEQERESSQVWINEYTEGADMLSYAAREVAKGTYKSAIEVYQGLIEKVRKEKEFSSRVVAAGENVYLPIRKRCYEEILKLPPEGREIYGIMYEAKAQRMYELAAAKQDVSALLIVAQDYLLTPAGRKACITLADLCIERAEYSLALHYLDTLSNYHYRDSNEPVLCSLKRAACLLQSDEHSEAKKIIKEIQNKGLNSDESRICGCLTELTKSVSTEQKDIFNSFYDGFVNLKSSPPISVVEKPGENKSDCLDWRFRLERKNDQTKRSSGYMNYNVMADGMRGFDLFPVFYNNLVFLNDSSRIYALAAQGGKIKWREPDLDTAKVDGLPLGSFISDGKLFAVLRNSKSYSTPRYTGRGSTLPPVPAINELYCFNADSFGDNPELWNTGSLRESTDLKQTSFTSIPYVDGSRVYITGIEITEQDQNYCVTCISTDGEFLWQTRFCATKWTAQRSLLRAASLSISRGKVIVCTNVGVAASLSAFTGELEWVYKYPLSTVPDMPTNMMQPSIVTWQPTPPIVWYGTHPADGQRCEALILAPGDSDFILGFDMEARRLLWRWERTNHTYVIGPRGEDIFVYGGTSLESSDYVVRQHRIPDGLIRWEATIPSSAFEENDRVFGKGIATPDALYLPCSKQLIKIIDGKDEKAYFGKVDAAATWYSFSEGKKETKSADSTDPNQQRVQRILAAQGVITGGSNAERPDESRLRGNLLLLPDRIITSGCTWTNSFKAPKASNK